MEYASLEWDSFLSFRGLTDTGIFYDSVDLTSVRMIILSYRGSFSRSCTYYEPFLTQLRDALPSRLVPSAPTYTRVHQSLR